MHPIQSIKGFIGRTLLIKEWLDDEPLTEARIKTCKGCKFYDTEVDTCKICTCIIASKARSKVSVNIFSFPPHYEDTHCPLGKWPVRNENGEIGGSDLEITNFWRTQKGKAEIK